MTTAVGSVLSEIRQQLPLTEYLASKGHALRQTGRSRMIALCPFHVDKHRPNLVIYADEQRFHCFSCGAHGDVVDMVQHLEGHPDFTTALRALADRLRVAWPNERPSRSEDIDGVLTLVAKLYAEHLSADALAYLGSRGFPEPFVRNWRIGQRIRYFRARDGEPRLLREGDSTTASDADADYYVQRLYTLYCQQFAQAYANLYTQLNNGVAVTAVTAQSSISANR